MVASQDSDTVSVKSVVSGLDQRLYEREEGRRGRIAARSLVGRNRQTSWGTRPGVGSIMFSGALSRGGIVARVLEAINAARKGFGWRTWAPGGGWHPAWDWDSGEKACLEFRKQLKAGRIRSPECVI